MAQPRVIVRGYRETDRAFRKISKEISGGMRDDFKKAAEPVADAARTKIGRFAGASLGTIKPVALARGVVVRQDARTVTGTRPDFGSVQMRLGLIPALTENIDEVTREIERALDRIADRAGF